MPMPAATPALKWCPAAGEIDDELVDNVLDEGAEV